MENREREEAAIDGLEDDALELSLGLRPAPVRLPNLKIPADKPPEIAVREIPGDLSLKSESEKELQAARRREAMRKRKSKASAMNEVCSERRRRRNGDESVVSATASFLPRLVGEEMKGIPPVTGGGVEKISGAGGNCSGGSSSGGSDYQSTSGQGGSSSDGGSPPDQQCRTPQKVPSPGDLGLESEKKPMSNEVARGPPDPSMGRGSEALLVSQMPCVSTTGNGPNGRTITGFLYRYTKSEVSIVCVCHGTAFSPAGFVEHAGGIDVENPLRRITVVPFALS